MSVWQELLAAWTLIWADSTSFALSPSIAPAWALALALALITLLVEDIAIAAGAAFAAAGILSWSWAFAGVAGGIAVGDIALYGLGAGAHRIVWLQTRWRSFSYGHAKRLAQLEERLNEQLPSAILLARVIPGLRLLTYTACGWLRLDLLRFCLWCCFAVASWTALLLYLSAKLGDHITNLTGLPPALAAALPVMALAVALPLIRYLHALYRAKTFNAKKETHDAA